jgi:hypothetical protein
MNRGIRLVAGRRCIRFVASFNVKAKIDEALPHPPLLHPDASISIDAEIRCDKATIQTTGKGYSHWVAAESSTHQANHWHFAAHTSVVVETAHQELINAIEKRRRMGRTAGED